MTVQLDASSPQSADDLTPDFIIAGAQKCGTSWLHHTLNSLPGISLPDEEIHLAEIDDFVSHPDFFRCHRKQIHCPNAEETSWVRTARDIRRKNPSDTIGWDSTILFHSHVSIRRLAREYGNVKIIVLLRNPVNRAYSQYWHRVRTGRCSYTFEKEILRGDKQIILRSIYRDQAAKFKQAFAERVHFVLYEDLFSNTMEEFASILRHLNITDVDFEYAVNNVLSNKINSSLIPNFLPGWLLASKLLMGLELGHYARKLARKQTLSSHRRELFYKLKLSAMVLAGCGYSRTRRPPPMSSSTRSLLTRYLRDANYGLSDIIGKDVEAAWFDSRAN